jgi:hypothetical protein
VPDDPAICIAGDQGAGADPVIGPSQVIDDAPLDRPAEGGSVHAANVRHVVGPFGAYRDRQGPYPERTPR